MFRFERLEGAQQRRNAVRLDAHPEVEFEEQQIKRRRFVRVFETVSDPMWAQQWNLKGTPVSLNVQDVWTKLNITGRGVQVSIVDDGLDFSHPDLKDNYAAIGSTDINFHKSDPTPYRYDGHGTSAAGCSSSMANNPFCGAGTAPQSKVSGIRLIAESTTDADEGEGLSHRLDVNHILSSSWGPFDDGNRLEGPGPVLEAAFKQGVTEGRGGKGTIYVWAAGNGRAARDNCNYDGYANNRYTIPVAAIIVNGNPAYYSEPCAATFCAVPSSGGMNGGISTIDLQSRCTSTFGGTSAAAPQMAGVVALMLEANPNLTWRDVQHVIAKSAIRRNLQNSGWTLNGGGFSHNHDYGFGRIDAVTTVQLAKSWVNVPASAPEFRSGRVNVNLPISATEVVGSVNVSSAIDFVEHVDVIFHARTPARGNLEVFVDSPFGTRSFLATPHNDRANDYPQQGWKFGTVRNWGEDSKGVWRVSCKDSAAMGRGTFTWFELVIYGYQKAKQ